MAFLTDLTARFKREHVTLALDDIQALILRSRPEPYVGLHAMLHIDDAEGGRDLIRRMAEHIPSAAGWTDDREAWMGMALSFQGLKALEVPQASLDSFPLPFQQGMAQRSEQLRDVGSNAPEHWDPAFQPGTCHLALTIYARDQAALDVAKAKAMDELGRSHGVTLVAQHAFGADADAKNPFGFRDSISQPSIAGSGIAPTPGQERAIAAGEFILGENSETGAPVAMPDPTELGRNGSFVVLRKYQSQVGAFNDFIRNQASSEADEELLAAKMVGRWRSGAPLVMSPDHDDATLGADPGRNNDFDFSKDPRGLLCPHAAHMRRLNPRDSQLTILTDINIHRIIRRSSTFGPKWQRSLTAQDDKGDSGIFFIFISARAYDTIEFFQQEWINRGNFIDLGEERDPLVGLQEPPGSFTIPETPVRRRIDGVNTFNRLRGGEYLFMPSLSALRWIGNADWR
ncbi:Dyp-type peroxidase family [Duganella sacchari]|uniref:Dyp-type peroxidase family n=1 Tax=Duganella sacchari TaxID=551987 RepID=A0A1M7LIU0_9BURK|nr:Dyp-type peroxidase [Duganella sacchari]SHM78072.1 Dyp-type peroxidase family [Duganella sacchari]